MKKDRKPRYLLAAAVVIAIFETPGKAQEPVEWCQTYVKWVAKVGNQRAVAQGECPVEGPCDRPSVRGSWIPEPCTPTVRIRVKLNIFCNTDGTNCASPRDGSGVAAQMAQLNSDFAPHRIQFAWNTQYIHNTTYRVFEDSEDVAMKNAYADDPARQINVYVVHVAAGWLGLGTFPWDPDPLGNLGGIIIDDNSFGAERNVLTHEVGHNLGLWHTYHGFEVNPCSACYERADRKEADTTGDLASHTPPNSACCGCGPPPGQDTCSEPPTTPWPPAQPENYMSTAPDECRRMFTSQQAGRKHCWIHDVLTGWITCTTNGECDDRSECTQDACIDGGCQNTPYPDATACAGGVCCAGWCSARSTMATIA